MSLIAARYTLAMKLSTKLFLILLGVTGTMLLVAMGLARYSFQQGFVEFVGGMEKARLQQLGEALVIEYESNNNEWDWLSEQGLDSFLAPKQRRGDSRPKRRAPPNKDLGPDRRAGLPPPPPRGTSDGFGVGPEGMAKLSRPPTAVFNREEVFISGIDNSAQYETVFTYALVSNGQAIGELRSWPSIEGSSELTSLFARQQFWSSVVIALFCLLLAGGVSWLLSRKLLTPIHQLHYSISKLNDGKYGDSVNAQGSDELGELMKNVDNLSQTLAKNRSAKNRMFADISHELRTPLTVLAGEIDLLKAGIRPFNQEQLLSLEQESDRLRHLIDDLYQLSLSDVGALKYTFVHADLSGCLLRAVSSVQQHSVNKDIQISTDLADNIFVEMDEKRIEQLFLNVLMNAMSYTDSPGFINASVVAGEERVTINIMDSAPSVTTEQCDKLFDPLYRVDESRTRRESGAGLGLAICKNIVEAHNGTISAAPSNIGGLSMTISLPIARMAK